MITIGAVELIGLLFTAGGAVVTVVVWLVRLEGKVREAAVQRQSDVELFNVKLGTLDRNASEFKHEITPRVRGLERIVGRAKVFDDDPDSE